MDFVEREDGTRVEVKQRKVEMGEEVKNDSGGRKYRVVSHASKCLSPPTLTIDHETVYGARVSEKLLGIEEVDWRIGTTASKRSRTGSSWWTMIADRS